MSVSGQVRNEPDLPRALAEGLLEDVEAAISDFPTAGRRKLAAVPLVLIVLSRPGSGEQSLALDLDWIPEAGNTVILPDGRCCLVISSTRDPRSWYAATLIADETTA